MVIVAIITHALTRCSFFFPRRIKDESVTKTVARRVEEKSLSDFNSQNLSNTIWSLATLGACQYVNALEKLKAEIASRNLREFKSQELSNVLWCVVVLLYSILFFLRSTDVEGGNKRSFATLKSSFPECSKMELQSLFSSIGEQFFLWASSGEKI